MIRTGRIVVGEMLHQASLEKPTVPIRRIKEIVAREMSVTVQEMNGQSRRRLTARARMVAVYFAREFTHGTYAGIGHAFGGRDHSTIKHACIRIPELIVDNETFRLRTEQIRFLLYNAARRKPRCTACSGARIVACDSGQEYASMRCPECGDD